MMRDVDLASYLPPFIADYNETNTTLEAENPEFILLWSAADQVLRNEFIATADEYGISRFEKLLNIFPSKQYSLEIRRARVQSKWFNRLPYTWRMLIQKMAILCGDSDFKVYIPNGAWYGIGICVSIEPERESLLYEVERMLKEFLPVNLYYHVTGAAVRKKVTRVFVGSGRGVCIKLKASPESLEAHSVITISLKSAIGTIEHIRTIYLPERN